MMLNLQVVEIPVTMLVSIRPRPIRKIAKSVAVNWNTLKIADNILVFSVGRLNMQISGVRTGIIFVISAMAKVFLIQ